MSEWPYFVLTVKKWPELQKEKKKKKNQKKQLLLFQFLYLNYHHLIEKSSWPVLCDVQKYIN